MVRLRNERSPEQSRSRQHGQPFSIADIGLTPRQILHMPRVNYLGSDADLLKSSVRALPLNAGALHDDLGRINGCTPLCQGPAVTLERTKLTMHLAKTTLVIFNQSTCRNLSLMNIKADRMTIDRFNFHILSVLFH